MMHKHFYFLFFSLIILFLGCQSSSKNVESDDLHSFINQAPIANDQSVSVDKNSSVAITLSATDANSDPLTYTIITQPTNGTLSGSAPNLTYTPNTNYVGSDSFSFRANDGKVDSNIATITITINQVNQAPIANDQSVSVDKNSSVAITLSATDANSDPLTYTIITQPTNGTLSGSAPNLTYTPNTNYVGSDSFSFRANDGKVDSNIATININVKNSKTILSANHVGYGVEPTLTDGTQDGTVMIKDINPAATRSVSIINSIYVKIGSIFYFVADDGVHDWELWRSDGTEDGTYMVKDIKTNGSGLDVEFHYLTNMNGILYFIADDGVHGKELWRSDGSESGTFMVKDINIGSGGSSPSQLVFINGILYFSANDGVNGRELWRSDGSESGTFMVKDIFQGANSSSPDSLTNIDGILYFGARNGDGIELWRSDGTSGGTVMIKDINQNGDSYPRDFVKLNNLIYFFADDGVHGRELWRSDGTSGGTVMVKDINLGVGDSVDLLGKSYMINIGNILYFKASDGVSAGKHGTELWRSDGTSGGTVMIKDIRSGAFSSNITDLIEFNGSLYFLAYDGFYKSDGDENSTLKISHHSSSIHSLKKVDGVLYYYDYYNNLYRSDGTENGTYKLK